MYYDFTIQIPKIEGKIIKRPKGNSIYVLFQHGQKYNRKTQHTTPERTIIGKLYEKNSDLMYPNGNFEKFFPDVVLPEELPEAYRSCALRIGAYSVIRFVMQEYKLPQLLDKCFKKDCGLLLDLVSYLIVDEENAGQYYPDFAFNHPLFSDGMRVYSDSKVCRFLQSISKDQTFYFLDEWNKKRNHKQRIYISYDSTNKNCQAGDIDLVEYGKAKDEKGLPVFNVALAFDKTNRVPLFYEEYPGSITDVSQFVYMVDKVIEYGYKSIGFILDRGYFSKDNIRYMEANRYAFVIMVKGQKELVSSIVMKNRGSFETDRDCCIRSCRVYGKTVTSKLYEDDTCERYFHIYFKASKESAEREQIEQQLDKMKLYLDKHKGEKLTLGAIYDEYFIINRDKAGNLLSYEERKDVIQRKLQLCGYFCIITSDNMKASQALVHYKGRDISEKLFMVDKSFIGSKSERVKYAVSLSSKVFIEFIALIVRNRIYNLLKETMLRMETRPNYMTVPAAIRELEKIEMVRRSNGKYRLDHAVSKRQRTILSAFGMNDDDIKRIAAEIGNLLESGKALTTEANDADEEEDDDGTYEIDIVD